MRILLDLRRGLRLLRREGFRGLAERLAAARVLRDASYAFWIGRYDRLSDADRALIRKRIASFRDPPLFSILVQAGEAPSGSLESLSRQIYPHWELVLSPEAGLKEIPRALRNDSRVRRAGRRGALQHSEGNLILMLEGSDALAEHALYMVAEELESHPDSDLIYSDQDWLDSSGRRCEPWFKSDWNPDLLLSHDYIGPIAAFRTSALREIWDSEKGAGGVYEWILRLTERAAPLRVRHIPHVLCHRTRTAPAPDRSRVVEAHLERRGVGARVESLNALGRYRIRYPLPVDRPLVSILVPTRDRLELLRRCVEGLLHRTTYDPFELIIVDNRSEDPETLLYLEALEAKPRVRVLRYDAPFDFAALNNWAARQTSGALLAFLNNDTEVISPDWLEEMASQALRPEVGAVGAKLLYPDDTVQHGGIVLGIGGIAGHAHRGLPRDAEGYQGRAMLVQNVSAVTAACMVLRREVFEEVGGFDSENLGVAFNDVDLCLRIGDRGYRILWTPFAELYHHESVSLGLPEEPQRRERFAREAAVLISRWKEKIENDPAYSPNLTLRRGDSSLAFPPRREKPWISASNGSADGVQKSSEIG